MFLAKLINVKKYYGDRLILDINKFEINEGDRIGLVGDNGAGKTTLIKSLIGEEVVEEGSIYLTESFSYVNQIQDYKGNSFDNKVKSIFKSPDKYTDYLSGGEKVKLKITKALSENKKLIIADEPTSNLDSSSIAALEEVLKSHKGSLLIVSHDRNFLDSLCNIIVEIDKGKLNVYPGNYSKYLILKSKEKERAKTEYSNYINEKKRLEQAVFIKEGTRNNIKRTPKRMGNSEARLHKMGGQKAKKNLDNNIKNIKSRIEHLEIKEKPLNSKDIKIIIQESLDLFSRIPIEAKNLTLKVGDKELLKDANFKIIKGKKVALIGDNGSGKTSLLKAIVKNSNPNIKLSPNIVLGYFDQSLAILNKDKSILDNIKLDSSFSETFIRINLDGFGFKGDTVFNEVSTLSGGEQVKVALCKVLLSDNNLIILDEPTNYLDIKSMEALENSLKNSDKTLIIVSHDRKFIANLCDYILEIKNGAINEFNGSYSQLIVDKAKPKIDTHEKKNKEAIMILENKLSEIISLISLEKDSNKKEALDKDYFSILSELRKLRG